MEKEVNYQSIALKLKSYLMNTDLFTPRRGLFTCEGSDGAGKSTCCRTICKNYPIELHILPGGGTEAGMQIRGLIKDVNLQMHPLTKYNLYLAADSEFFFVTLNKIKKPILLDRSWMSRLIYQVLIKGINLEKALLDLSANYNRNFPEKTVILTCEPDVVRERLNSRGESMDEWDLLVDEVYKHYNGLAIEVCKAFEGNEKYLIKHLDTSYLTPNEVYKEVSRILF